MSEQSVTLSQPSFEFTVKLATDQLAYTPDAHTAYEVIGWSVPPLLCPPTSQAGGYNGTDLEIVRPVVDEKLYPPPTAIVSAGHVAVAHPSPAFAASVVVAVTTWVATGTQTAYALTGCAQPVKFVACTCQPVSSHIGAEMSITSPGVDPNMWPPPVAAVPAGHQATVSQPCPGCTVKLADVTWLVR